jgi:hypothetical protein
VRQPALARPAAHFTGVIDTLSAGYGVINRHPWLLLLPILLDLFLWLGPQYSIGRLVSRTLSGAQLGPNGEAGGLLDRAQQGELVQAFEGINLLSALAPGMIGIPSYAAALGVRDPLRSVPVESWSAAFGIVLGAGLFGLLLGSLYYAILAQAVREGGLSPFRLSQETVRGWLRVLQYVLLLFGLALLIGVPVGMLTVAATLVSPALGGLVLWSATLALLWLGIYLNFAPNAIFVSRVGPLAAVRNSVAVVRLSFWATLGFVGLMTLVLLGMGQVWDRAAQQIAEPWGIALSVLGNAYIASGLIAASMRFYRERIEFLGANGQWAVGSGQSGAGDTRASAG